MLFFKVLAWVFLIWSFLVVVVKVYLGINYEGSIEQFNDRKKGLRDPYRQNLGYWALAFIICLAFLIAS